MASVAGVMVADIAAARRFDRPSNGRVSKTFTVNRPPEEVAQLWLDLQMLPEADNIRFDCAPGGRGTEVRVQFRPHLFGSMRQGAVQEQLRQFKQLAETGEVARSDERARVLQPAPSMDGGGR
jgi:uncharacterized membrane protein